LSAADDFRSYYKQFADNIAAVVRTRFTGGPEIEALVCQIKNDPRVNARATRTSPTNYKYLVEVFDGLVVSIAAVFVRCLANSELPYLRLPPRDGFKDDNARMTLDRMLMQHAFAFVTLHELAHVINGHLTFLASLGLTEMMDETSSSATTPDRLSRFDRQALEFNADATAAVFLANRLFEVTTKPDQFPDERSNSFYVTADIALEILLFSIFCFFGATGYSVSSWDDARQQRSHPPSAVRQISLVHTLHQFLSTRHPGWLHDPVEQIAARAQGNWMRFAAASDPDRAILSAQLNDPAALRYWFDLNQNWGRLMMTFEPLKHGGKRRDIDSEKN
jgi:hypothetical protein